MTTAHHFFRPDEAVGGDVLLYEECGLDNVYLLNGFTKEELDGEEFVSVTDIDGLNTAIGMHIVLHRKAPSGKELKFLRSQIDMSQSELAELLAVSDQSVARWEKGKFEVPGPAVLALRCVFILRKSEDDVRVQVLSELLSTLKELTDSDETNDVAQFVYCGDSWSDQNCVAA